MPTIIIKPSTPWQKPFRGTQLNRTHPLARGLVGCWLMNEGTGNRVFDYSGNGNQGTLTNIDQTTDWVAGRDGWALEFDGTNEHIEINSIWDSFPIADTPFTITAWFNTTDVTTQQEIVDIGAGQSATIQGFRILVGFPSGGATGQLLGSSTRWSSSTTTTLSNNTWYFLAFTYDATTRRLYLNGVEEDFDTDGDWEIHTNAKIGLEDSNSADFVGLISDVRIFKRALPAEEVLSLFVNQYAMFNRNRILSIESLNPANMFSRRFSNTLLRM